MFGRKVLLLVLDGDSIRGASRYPTREFEAAHPAKEASIACPKTGECVTRRDFSPPGKVRGLKSKKCS